MCIDSRTVNNVVKKIAYPLPYIKDILDSLQDAYVCSSLGLEAGFHEISLEAKTKPLTAFAVPGRGLFQYRVLPFVLRLTTGFRSRCFCISRRHTDRQQNLRRTFNFIRSNLYVSTECQIKTELGPVLVFENAFAVPGTRYWSRSNLSF